MNTYIDTRNQMLGIHAGIIFLLCFAVGLALVAPLVPPPSPMLSGEEIRAFFTEHAWRIKLGGFITMIGAGLQVPLYVTLMCQMSRMERGMPVLGITQLVIGAYNCAFFILGPVIWVTIAFRPDISADVARSLNDLGWIIYFFITSPAIVANIAIAISIFRNVNDIPVLPRWFAYVNIWVAVTFLAEAFMPFFKSGPFAWNGIISFWMVIAAFFIWFSSLVYCLITAVRQQAAEQDARQDLGVHRLDGPVRSKQSVFGDGVPQR